MSFLFGLNSVSFAGPDEDFTGREVTCCRPDGTELGTAVLLEQIAFAGFSHVYKAFLSGDGLEGRVVAAKVLTTGYSHSAAKAEKLLNRLYERELAALKAVQHPHVIELLGVGEVSMHMQPETPDRADTPTHGLGTPSIDEHAHHLATVGSSVPGSSPHAAPDNDNSSTLAAGTPLHRHNSLTNTAPYLPFHRPGAMPPQPQLSRLNSCPREPVEAGPAMSSSLGGHAGNQGLPAHFRTRPSLPAGVRSSLNTSSITTNQPASPAAHHLQLHPSSPLESNSYRPTSISGQTDAPYSTSSQPGIPGTPQGAVQSILFSKQNSNSFRQSFLNRLPPHHRPLPSLTFSTRRSINSTPGAAYAANATRRVLFIQWMPGGDARTLIDQAMRPMEEAAVATIMLPILQALDAAHKAGIVHRDVKAGNILLAPGPRQVRLGDWGISVHAAESSSRMSNSGGAVRQPGAVGTEFWCAPEIELGQAHDHKSDLFSLGITFIELVTGRDPKYDNSAVGFTKMLDPETGLIPDFLSQEAREWLASCLAVDPSARPSAAQLLNHPYFLATLQRMEREEAEMMEDDGEESTGVSIPVGVTPAPGDSRSSLDPPAPASSQSVHTAGRLTHNTDINKYHLSSGCATGGAVKGSIGALRASLHSDARTKAAADASQRTSGQQPAIKAETDDVFGPAPYLVEEPLQATSRPLCGCAVS